MTKENNSPKTLLDEKDLRDMGLAKLATLRKWRLLRRGPRFLKCGTSVKYRLQDVTDWLNSRPSGGEQKGKR